jgi:hypothetical protein
VPLSVSEATTRVRWGRTGLRPEIAPLSGEDRSIDPSPLSSRGRGRGAPGSGALAHRARR